MQFLDMQVAVVGSVDTWDAVVDGVQMVLGTLVQRHFADTQMHFVGIQIVDIQIGCVEVHLIDT